MTGPSSPYKSLLTTSVVVLSVAGLLGWVLALISDGVAGWLPVAGLLAVAASGLLVVVASRRIVRQAHQTSDLRAAATGGGWMNRTDTFPSADISARAGDETRPPLYARVAGEIARAGRYGSDFCLIALLVDRPEDGPEAELDRSLLMTVGEIVQNSTRVSDAFGPSQTGGITVILVETETRGAERVAEKLRRNVEVFPFDRRHQVTVSLGIADFRIGDSADTLIERAEGACRRAAAEGGNRVAVGKA